MILVLVLGASITQASADRQVISNVPYIHQVQDMDKGLFRGYDACGPTTAVMALQYYHLQPESPNQYPGYYVYSPYNGFTDKEGNFYNRDYASDWYPNHDPEYPHSVPGAHGYIVGLDGPGGWKAFAGKLKSYFENHGLTVQRVDTDVFAAITQSIQAGLPVVAHTNVTYHGGTYGHFLLVIGVDGNNRVVVNDPFGDVNVTWIGTTSGASVTYDLASLNPNHVRIDWVYLVMPVGFYTDGWHDNQCPDSQLFLDAYEANGGYQRVGMPWNNGKGNYVHCWPDNCSDPKALWVQDFLKDNTWSQLVVNRQQGGKAYLVQGKILEYWSSHYGYRDFGAPTQLVTHVSDNWQGATDWTIQNFSYGKYIAYSPSKGYSTGINPTAGINTSMATISAASYNMTNAAPDGSGIVVGSFNAAGNPVITPAALPCEYDTRVPVEDWASGRYYNGLLMNGRMDICGGYGWAGYAAQSGSGASYGCNQGDNTRGPANCVMSICTTSLWGSVFPTHATQLTNNRGAVYPLEIEAGKVYLLTFLAKANGPHHLEVALTPRAAYEGNDNYLGDLTNILARTTKISLASEWKTYIVHLLPTASDLNAALRFFAGGEVGCIYLDDIKLEEVAPPANLTPSLTLSRAADGQITATLAYAERNGYLYGLTDSAVTRYDIVTAELEQLDGTGYGVDSQSFDPYGNTLYLPSNRDQKKVWFYLVDRTGGRHYLNLSVWAYSGGAKLYLYGNDALDYSQLWPSYQPPQLSLSGNQISVTYQTDAQGNLVGFQGGALKPSEACMLVVYLHGQQNEYTRLPFNQNGNSFNLNRQFPYDHFSFALTKEGDSTGHLYWLDPIQYHLNQPLRINYGWLRWKWTQ